mmetsp:Transcript_2360/g.7768  ORF Transcript_2360/g.7768 Transcript_2360/m.7768 type:complete len:203 (-) Transcript_2360:4097-4705(-)
MASFICSRNSASIWSKRFASSGSCSRMSSEPRKMDSSEHHARCTSSHTSSTARTVPSLPFQSVICVSKNPMKRLPIMFCSATSLSSSASYTSGGCWRICTPVFLNGAYSRPKPDQVCAIFLSCASSLISARACSTTSDTPSWKRWSSSRRSDSSCSLSSRMKDLPHVAMSFCQWRSRIASSRRSWMSGRSMAISDMAVVRPW